MGPVVLESIEYRKSAVASEKHVSSMPSTVKAMCFRAYENITITKQNERFIRQPALRLFAAELAESKQTIIEHIEGRDFDSHYQLIPTGVKAKRVLMMGALLEVDNVGTSGEYLRGRIVDRTGGIQCIRRPLPVRGFAVPIPSNLISSNPAAFGKLRVMLQNTSCNNIIPSVYNYFSAKFIYYNTNLNLRQQIVVVI